MPKIRIVALTAIAAAFMASAAVARDAGERGPVSGVSPSSTLIVASAGRNAAPRSGGAASPNAVAFVLAQASTTGRNDCVRLHCGSMAE